MPTDPAAQAAYRVPRSEVDNLFIRGEPLSASRVGTGVVVSIDSSTTCTVLINDVEISGVIWLGLIPPRVGDVVEVEQRGDLLVITAINDLDAFMEGMEDDAEHLISDADPGKPPPRPVNVGGSFRDVDAWEFLGSDLLDWTRVLNASGQGMVLTQIPGAPNAVATLWNEESFEVEPGDVIDVAARFTELVPTSTVQVVLLYGIVEDQNAFPGDMGTTETSYGAATTVVGTDTALAATATVPANLVAGVPRTAKLGFRLTGDIDASLVATSATVTRTPKGYPSGSLWLDPSGQRPALTTAASATTTATTLQPQNVVGTWYKAVGVRKVVVQAPPGVAGLMQVHMSGSVVCASTADLQLRLVSATGTVLSNQIRTLSNGTPGDVVPFFLTALLPVPLGGIDEVSMEYSYATGGAAHSLWNPTVQTMFLPGAVMAGAAAQDPLIRWWDGDTWRPSMLAPAAVDVSQNGTTPPAGKTNTSTSMTRSSAVLHEGETLTLTATVTPSSVSGSVTFSTSTSSSGPWTSLGTAPLVGGVASKVWTATRGVKYFKASYVGDSSYNASESIVASVIVQYRVTSTVTMWATKAQAYLGNNEFVTGTGEDRAVHQGFYASNRKSLLWFSNSVPTGATISSAQLICKNGGWTYWNNAAGGTLVLGSFRNQATIPTTYPGSKAIEDRSRHSVDTGGFTVNITSWAASELNRSDWNGIVFGRGPSEAGVYKGHSAVPGEDYFSLKVTYSAWVTPS